MGIAGFEKLLALPGCSLLEIAGNEPDQISRAVFSEYHHRGMLKAGFMLKPGHTKLCHYVGQQPQLFDLANDPAADNDLAGKPEIAETLDDMGKHVAEYL